MEIGLGILGRSSAAFWSMTWPEFTAALDGYMEARGQRRPAGRAPLREEIEEMMRRFPD